MSTAHPNWPFPTGTEPIKPPPAADDLALLRDALALARLVSQPLYGSKFPSHPKPPQEWWSDVRAKVEPLRSALARRLNETEQA